MRKAGWSFVVVWALVLGVLFVGQVRAEASVGDALKNGWTYLFSPVNCVANWGVDVWQATLKAGYCVLGNANRNPVTLDPVVTIH